MCATIIYSSYANSTPDNHSTVLTWAIEAGHVVERCLGSGDGFTGFQRGKVCRQPVCRLPTLKTAAHPLSATAESVFSQTTRSNNTTCLRLLFQSLEKQQTPASCVIVVVILRSVALLGQSLTPVSDPTWPNPSLHQDPICRNKGVVLHDLNGSGPPEVTLYIHHDYDRSKPADTEARKCRFVDCLSISDCHLNDSRWLPSCQLMERTGEYALCPSLLSHSS